MVNALDQSEPNIPPKEASPLHPKLKQVYDAVNHAIQLKGTEDDFRIFDSQGKPFLRRLAGISKAAEENRGAESAIQAYLETNDYLPGNFRFRRVLQDQYKSRNPINTSPRDILSNGTIEQVLKEFGIIEPNEELDQKTLAELRVAQREQKHMDKDQWLGDIVGLKTRFPGVRLALWPSYVSAERVNEIQLAFDARCVLPDGIKPTGTYVDGQTRADITVRPPAAIPIKTERLPY